MATRDQYHWERTGEHEYAAGNGAHVWSGNGGKTWHACSGRRRLGECTQLYGAMALAEVEPEPINPGLHAHLIEMGFTYQYHPPYEEGGDAENGPGLVVPDFDEYVSDEYRIIIDCDGHFGQFEERSLTAEDWANMQHYTALVLWEGEDATHH